MGITALKRLRSPHQPTGTWIRRDSRLALNLRDRFMCLICGTDLHGADPRDITLDHRIPRVKGGSNEPSNLYTCCRSCNCARQDKPLHKFAPPASLARINRNVRRDMKPYRKLAKAIIVGEVGMEEALARE